MNLTDIKRSDLTPHLRAYLDDLISMTSNLVLKRSDIAAQFEDDDSVKLAHYYDTLINDPENFTWSLFDKIPLDVIKTEVYWDNAYPEEISFFPVIDPEIDCEKNEDGTYKSKPFYDYNDAARMCYTTKLSDNTISEGNNIESTKIIEMGALGDALIDLIGWTYVGADKVYLKRCVTDEDDNPKEITIGGRTTYEYRLIDITDTYSNITLAEGEYPLKDTSDDIPNTIDPRNIYLLISGKMIDYSDESYKFYNDENGNEALNDKIGLYIREPILLYWVKRLKYAGELSDVVNDKSLIKVSDRDSIVEKMKAWVVKAYIDPDRSPYKDFRTKRYFGEYNYYYRLLNGLPAVEDMSKQPKIVMSEYFNDETKYSKGDTKVLYELTDSEIEYLKATGKFDELLSLYPSAGYLRYMGSNRIDVLKARKADHYSIIKIGSSKNKAHEDLFLKNYNSAKEFILNRYNYPELFSSETYYKAFISYLIVAYAMMQSVAHNDSILLNHLYADEETVKLRLQSYGLNVFDDIPLVYRKNIAKNIEGLIYNKGINTIYNLIAECFDIDTIEIYRYFFRKVYDPSGSGDQVLTMSQVPIDSEKFINDIIDDINRVPYENITENDIYWGAYGMVSKDSLIGSKNEIDDELKRKIMDHTFNYMNSKYISLNAVFNLSKLNFNASYLMNYLLDLSNRDLGIKIQMDGMDDQSLFHLLVFLFAIQAKRLGYDGNIQHDPISVSYVMKFNIDQTVTIGDDTISLFDLLKEYYAGQHYVWMMNKYYPERQYDEAAKRYNDVRIKEMHERPITETMVNDDSLVRLNIPENISISSICDAYLYDSGLDGAYANLLRLRESSENYADYKAFNELLECLTLAKINNTLFTITEPEWVDVDTVDNKFITWVRVTDTDTIENLMNQYNEDIHHEIICTSYSYPELSLGSLGSYCIDTTSINDETPRVYHKEDLLSRPYNEDTILLSKNRIVYVSNTMPDINDTDYETVYWYNTNNNSLKVYLNKARTYEEYLKYENTDMYDMIQPTDADIEESNGVLYYRKEYFERLEELYTNTILAIERVISNDEVKNMMTKSFTDLGLLTVYMRKVINVFKSFMIDIATIDIIYEIDDPNKYRFRFIDDLSIDSDECHFDHLHWIDLLGIEEDSIMDIDGFTIRDELNIEEIKKGV